MLDGRLICGLVGVDVFGRLGVSTVSAWSVLLSTGHLRGRLGQGPQSC